MALTKIQTNALADDAVTQDKVANDAIDLTEIKAGVDGKIISYDASGNPVAIGPGTDGQVLTSTGAGSPPAFETPAAGGLSDIVNDTSPQLGGNLDVNGQNIASVSNGNINLNPDGTGHVGINGDAQFAGSTTNVLAYWDKSANALEFKDQGGTSAKAVFGTGDDLSIYHDGTDNQIKSDNGKVVISTTAGDADIEVSPNGTGDVVIDGLKYPQADGSAGQFLKTDGSAQLSWGSVSSVGGATGVDFNDAVKARFGTGNDLEIYHDNTAGHSKIVDSGTGNLILQSNRFVVANAAGTENLIAADEDGGVDLYYNNTKTLEVKDSHVKGKGVTIQQAWDSDVTYGTSRSGGAGYSDSNLGPVSITPKYSTSKLEITASQQYSLSGGTYNRGSITVWRSNDGGSNWSQVTFAPRDSHGTFLFGTGSTDAIKGYWTINFVNDASQTTEVQFKTMINCYYDGSIVVNETSNDVQRCWITVREYTP